MDVKKIVGVSRRARPLWSPVLGGDKPPPLLHQNLEGLSRDFAPPEGAVKPAHSTNQLPQPNHQFYGHSYRLGKGAKVWLSGKHE